MAKEVLGRVRGRRHTFNSLARAIGRMNAGANDDQQSTLGQLVHRVAARIERKMLDCLAEGKE